MSDSNLLIEGPYYLFLPKMNKDLRRYIASSKRNSRNNPTSKNSLKYEAFKKITILDSAPFLIPNYELSPVRYPDIKLSSSFPRRVLADYDISTRKEGISAQESAEDHLSDSAFTHLRSTMSNIESYIKNNTQMIIEAPFKINAFALTKNRKYLIYGTTNGNIALFDTQKRLIKNDVPLTTHSIFNILITQDESYIIACGQGSSIKVYRYPSLELHTELQGHTDNVMRLIQSSDEFWLYSCSEDGTVRSWNLRDFTPGEILMRHNGKCKAICLSSDERYLFSGGEDKDIKVFDMIKNRQFTQLVGHANWVWALAVSPNSKWLASGSSDNTIKLWKMSSFECVATLRGHSKRLSVLQFSPDNQFLVSASTDHTLRVWKMDKQKNYPYKILLGHENWVKAMMINPDQKIIYSAGEDKTFRIWSFPNEIEDEILILDEKPIVCFSISSSMKYLAYVGDEDVLKIWDIKSNRLYYYRKMPAKITTCKISPDSSFLIIALDNGSLHSYDFTREEYSSLFEAHVGTIKTLDFNSSGSLLLTGGNDTRIGVWDFPSFKLKYYLRGHSSLILCLATSYDNSYIISGCNDNKIKVWKCSNGKCTHTIGISDVSITRLALMKSLNIMITGYNTGSISLINFKTKSTETEFKSHKKPITGLYILQDESHLISSDEGGLINFWNLTYRQHLTSIVTNSLSNMQVSSDENYLYLAENEKIHKIKNPLKDDKMNIYGPLPARNFISYMNDIILEKKTPPYDKNYDEFIITPYRINPVHLYAYYGLKEYLQNSLNNKFRFNKTADHHTALSISLYRSDTEITEIILRKLSEEMKENRYLAGTLGNCINMLTRQGNTLLPQLYANLMIVSVQNLPRYTSSDYSFPIYYLSDKLQVDKTNFINTTEKEDKVILFQQSCIRQDYSMGSTQSIDFLDSILHCPNDTIFTTSFIRYILAYKWPICKSHLQRSAKHHALYTFSAILLHSILSNYNIFLFPTILLHLIYLYMTLKPFSISQYNSITLNTPYSMMNKCKSSMILGYILSMLFSYEDGMYALFIGICCILNIEGLFYLEIYDTTRHIPMLLRSMVEQTKDMIIAVSYFGMWFVYLSWNGRDSEVGQIVGKGVNVMFGVGGMICMYLILCKVNYIYEKVQFRRNITDIKQICKMILDFEVSMKHVGKATNKSYLQVCDTPSKLSTSSKVNSKLEQLGDFVTENQSHILQRVQNIEKMVQTLNDARPKEEAKQDT